MISVNSQSLGDSSASSNEPIHEKELANTETPVRTFVVDIHSDGSMVSSSDDKTIGLVTTHTASGFSRFWLGASAKQVEWLPSSYEIAAVLGNGELLFLVYEPGRNCQ
jgi:hypothetical protein